MFYLKLAFTNIKKSYSDFAPFILASTVMFIMDLVLASIFFSPSLKKLPGAESISLLLGLGLIILSGFSLVILIYSYRFLMRKRSKEFGLYEILGLSKNQISRISILELMIIFLITLTLGSILGIVLAKFLYLIFVNLMGGDYFKLIISKNSLLLVSLIFVVIFLVLDLIALITIRRNSGLSLLKEESRGEREPRGSRILAFLSIICLGIGYYLAITVKNPMMALVIFFVAVVFVIIGTYLFYMSFTIWYLKKKKANKKYYYQPKNFITVSSMLYRMKQNALGLANITILVAMTFVTFATTTSLYFGVKEAIERAYPTTTSVHVDGARIDNINSLITSTNIPIKNLKSYIMSSSNLVSLPEKEKNLKMAGENDLRDGGMTYLSFVSREELVKLGNTDLPELSNNEILIRENLGNSEYKTIDWYGQSYKVKSYVKKLDNFSDDLTAARTDTWILANQEQVEKAMQAFNAKVDKNDESYSYLIFKDSTQARFDIPKGKEKAFDKAFEKTYDKMGNPFAIAVTHKSDVKETLTSFTGGFLFIGFTLGITFILGAALIIYYKQVSEGEEDKRSYKILQEIGLSKKEVAKTIKSQIKMVFMLPIVLAVIHFSFAYVMIKKLITLFGVTNTNLIFLVSVITITGVVLLYYLIYKQTSKTYYKIVERN